MQWIQVPTQATEKMGKRQGRISVPATYRYKAACASDVFSSTTASGLRFGGTFAAVATPRSAPHPDEFKLQTLKSAGLTFAGLPTADSTTSTQNNSGLVLEHNIAVRVLRLDLHCDCRRFALVKDF